MKKESQHSATSLMQGGAQSAHKNGRRQRTVCPRALSAALIN